MEKKEQYKFILIANFVVWSMMTLCDLIETKFENGYLIGIVFFLIAAVFTTYIVIDRKSCHDFNATRHVYFMFRFLIITLAISYMIITLVGHNMWIVRGMEGEYEHMIYGNEYFVVAIFLTVGCEMAFLIYTMIRSLGMAIHKKHGIS